MPSAVLLELHKCIVLALRGHYDRSTEPEPARVPLLSLDSTPAPLRPDWVPERIVHDRRRWTPTRNGIFATVQGLFVSEDRFICRCAGTGGECGALVRGASAPALAVHLAHAHIDVTARAPLWRCAWPRCGATVRLHPDGDALEPADVLRTAAAHVQRHMGAADFQCARCLMLFVGPGRFDEAAHRPACDAAREKLLGSLTTHSADQSDPVEYPWGTFVPVVVPATQATTTNEEHAPHDRAVQMEQEQKGCEAWRSSTSSPAAGKRRRSKEPARSPLGRRIRHRYPEAHQLAALKALYARTTDPSIAQRAALAAECGMSAAKVSNW
jgi:hypothetical protein